MNGLVQDISCAALDTLAARIAVVGQTGRIVLVNQAWRGDTDRTLSSLGLCRCGPGESFLESVNQSRLRCTDAWLLLRGVREVLECRRATFSCACRGAGRAWHAGLSIEVRSFEVGGSRHASVVLQEMPAPRSAIGTTDRRILIRACDVIGPHTPALTRMMDDLLGVFEAAQPLRNESAQTLRQRIRKHVRGLEIALMLALNSPSVIIARLRSGKRARAPSSEQRTAGTHAQPASRVHRG
jgi:hypothetical protein